MLAMGSTPWQTALETQLSVGYNLRLLISCPDKKGLPPPHGGGNAIRTGREVERRVLARAVRWHLEDRILVEDDRTALFE
jgi:hypothetical protein